MITLTNEDYERLLKKVVNAEHEVARLGKESAELDKTLRDSIRDLEEQLHALSLERDRYKTQAIHYKDLWEHLSQKTKGLVGGSGYGN